MPGTGRFVLLSSYPPADARVRQPGLVLSLRPGSLFIGFAGCPGFGGYLHGATPFSSAGSRCSPRLPDQSVERTDALFQAGEPRSRGQGRSVLRGSTPFFSTAVPTVAPSTGRARRKQSWNVIYNQSLRHCVCNGPGFSTRPGRSTTVAEEGDAASWRCGEAGEENVA